MHELPNKGRHIYEKFYEESKNVIGAIPLLSADDKLDDDLYRVRQNVIFETGYFLGILPKGKVILLKKGDIEIPSNIHGLVYVNYENQWKDELRKEINEWKTSANKS